MYNVCMIDVRSYVVENCPVYSYMLVLADFYVFCYWWLNNIVVVSGMVNLIRLWYPLMCRA